MTLTTTRRGALTILGGGLAWATAPSAGAWALGDVRAGPLTRAHAHNDYEHPRPLFDSLDHRIGSVEADVFLIDGELLIGHDLSDLDSSRTFESLYLEPLLGLIRANQGSVHQGSSAPLDLLIDLKTHGASTYREVDRHLRRYREIFTACVDGEVRPGPVTAVVSGDRGAREPMEAQQVRYAFYDGRLSDLDSPTPASFMPLISDDWSKVFGWQGLGPFPDAERERLLALVSHAHAGGRRIRFWGTSDQSGPPRDALWGELCDAGVDLLNTDDLAGLEAFLTARGE